MTKDKTGSQIILDADGVLLHYTEAFFSFAEHQYGMTAALSHRQIQSFTMADAFPSRTVDEVFGRVKEFARHPAFEFIAPIDGAVEGLGLLRRFVPDLDIHVVTSCGDEHETRRMRTRCIHSHFGSDITVHTLGLGENKSERLSAFERGAPFVDDSYKNVQAGKAAGLNSIWFKAGAGLIYHDQNEDKIKDSSPVRGWPDLTSHIMSVFGISPLKTPTFCPD